MRKLIIETGLETGVKKLKEHKRTGRRGKRRGRRGNGARGGEERRRKSRKRRGSCQYQGEKSETENERLASMKKKSQQLFLVCKAFH